MDSKNELENIAKIIKNLAEGKAAKISGDSEIYSNLKLVADKIKENKEEMNNLVKFNEKIIENSLEESKEKLTTVFESSRDGIVIMDAESKIIEINTRLSNLLKIKKENILGKKIIDFELFSNDDKKIMINDFCELSIGKHYFVREYIVKLNGIDTYFEIHSSALRKGKNLIGAVSIVRDITEQKNAEIALKKSEEKFRNQFLYYKELDDIKNDFISLLSHELKSPLVPIISYSDLFLNNILGSLTDEQKKAISSIKGSAQELLNMIEEILDISRIERGTMKYNYADIELNSLIEEIINSEKGFASSKGLKIINESENEKIILNSDKTKLSRVVHNLINNAIKFTEKGLIKIIFYKEKNFIIIKVKDSGIGIAEEKKNKIFTKFFQIDSSLSRKYKGTGIGLYNTKVVVEGLKGDISFESEENKGTTFIVKIPLKPVAENKTIAIIGASPDHGRMSNKAIRAYLKKGFKVYPINPKYEVIEGLKVYSSLSQLNIKPEVISVYTNPEITKTLIDEIVKISPKKVFFNPGSTDKFTLQEIDKTKLNYERLCSIMAIDENPQEY
ncbi:MAG: ATP-binding protein [Candidatus Nanoarchaeia archaeon]|nr:ATP-binding protein [Candidatus Nanoarchaeia archaeon]